LLVHPPGPPPFVGLRLREVGGEEKCMSDFSRHVKPDNNQWRFAARLAHLLAANSDASSPSRIRFRDGGDSKEQE